MKPGEMLSSMLLLATNAHFGQFDKGGRPYILHPLSVCHKLKTDDEELQCIAIGHDVIEDTKTTYADLEAAGMSPRVISGITALTKLPGQTYEQYKEQVKSNMDAVLVKMADIRHNTDMRRLKGVTDKDIQRMAKYMQFYSELTQVLHVYNSL